MSNFNDKFKVSIISSRVSIVAEEADYPGGALLQWFATEQVEEEASTSRIAQMLERIGDSATGLIMLDRELGKRTFAAPIKTEASEA